MSLRSFILHLKSNREVTIKASESDLKLLGLRGKESVTLSKGKGNPITIYSYNLVGIQYELSGGLTPKEVIINYCQGNSFDEDKFTKFNMTPYKRRTQRRQ